MLLYYIRHGDPTYVPDALTPLGKRQAEAVAKRVAAFGIDEIYTSSSTRAMETAAPTCEILKKEPIVLDWANELYSWDFTTIGKDGKHIWGFFDPDTIKLFNSNEVRALGADWHTHPAFANETFKSGIERVKKDAYPFLESLGYKHDEKECYYHPVAHNKKRIAFFAHQVFGLAFLSILLDIPYPVFCTHFDMGLSHVTVIEFAKTDDVVIPKMLMLSNDSHLFSDHLPTNYQNRIFI